MVYNEIKQVLFDKQAISNKVAEIGAQITKDCFGQKPLVVCTLKGAATFFADLVRHIDTDVEFDFVAASSYGNGTTSSGELRVSKDLSSNPRGRVVILVEDIIDTGRTLAHLKQNLLYRGAKQVKICTFLNKPSRRVVDVDIDYCGFVIPDEFVVGYGLDYAEKYRNLDYIGVLDRNCLKDL